jgi:acetyl esterase/lipase
VGGLTGEWIDGGAKRSGRTILFLHGGGYISGSASTHRNIAARIAGAASARA